MFLLIVITPEKDQPKEIETITSLFENGLKTLHVRKPNFAENELRFYLQKLPKKFHKLIVIHSHYNLTKEFRLKGIHLSGRNKKLRIKNAKVISGAFHSPEEILKSRRNYEYTFLSPIFDSISKQGYNSNFILEELSPILSKRKNIIALGGVNVKNIETIKQLGFKGAAVLGSVWESKNPVNAYKELRLKIK